MQTICTRYVEASLTRPRRIKAINSSRSTSIMIPLSDPRFDPEKYKVFNVTPEYLHHSIAARLLMDKLDWKGEMVGGALNNNGTIVWVFSGRPCLPFNMVSPMIERW